MRPIFLLLSLLILPSIAKTQDCLQYYPLTQDDSFAFETYDHKDKLEARMEYTVIERSGNEITYHVKLFDKDGELSSEMDFDLLCENGVAKVNMKNFVPQRSLEQMQSLESMDLKVEGDYLEFPNALSVGMTLPDATMTMRATVEGLGTMMSTTVTISDRKVEGMATVTVPIGTFECFKMTSTTNVKSSFLKLKSQTVSYIDPEEGYVKSESFNKKGKLESYTIRVH